MVKLQVVANEAPHFKDFGKGASQCRVEYRNIEWVSESKGVEEVWSLKAYNGKLLELREGSDLLYIF